MNLWRLERTRLFRTARWIILAAVFGVFGVLGPLTARYLPELLDALGADAELDLPPLTAVDGVAQYIGNVQQLGTLAIAFVAAAALAFDANGEMSIFLRTRATVRQIFTPRLVVNSVAAVAAFLFGIAIAYALTGVLLAWLPVGDFLVGTALYALYVVFSVSLIGLVASLVRNVVATALISLGALIVLGFLTLVSPLAPWLPSDLAGAIDVLLRGAGFDHWRALIVTVVLIVASYLIAIRRFEAREV